MTRRNDGARRHADDFDFHGIGLDAPQGGRARPCRSYGGCRGGAADEDDLLGVGPFDEEIFEDAEDFRPDRRGGETPGRIEGGTGDDLVSVTLSADMLRAVGIADDPDGVRLSPAYRRTPGGPVSILLVPDPEGTLFLPTAQRSPAFGPYVGGYRGTVRVPGVGNVRIPSQPVCVSASLDGRGLVVDVPARYVGGGGGPVSRALRSTSFGREDLAELGAVFGIVFGIVFVAALMATWIVR